MPLAGPRKGRAIPRSCARCLRHGVPCAPTALVDDAGCTWQTRPLAMRSSAASRRRRLARTHQHRVGPALDLPSQGETRSRKSVNIPKASRVLRRRRSQRVARKRSSTRVNGALQVVRLFDIAARRGRLGHLFSRAELRVITSADASSSRSYPAKGAGSNCVRPSQAGAGSHIQCSRPLFLAMLTTADSTRTGKGGHVPPLWFRKRSDQPAEVILPRSMICSGRRRDASGAVERAAGRRSPLRSGAGRRVARLQQHEPDPGRISVTGGIRRYPGRATTGSGRGDVRAHAPGTEAAIAAGSGSGRRRARRAGMRVAAEQGQDLAPRSESTAPHFARASAASAIASARIIRFAASTELRTARPHRDQPSRREAGPGDRRVRADAVAATRLPLSPSQGRRSGAPSRAGRARRPKRRWAHSLRAPMRGLRARLAGRQRLARRGAARVPVTRRTRFARSRLARGGPLRTPCHVAHRAARRAGRRGSDNEGRSARARGVCCARADPVPRPSRPCRRSS